MRWRSGRLGALPSLSVPVGVGGEWACVLSAWVFLVGAVAGVGVGVGWVGREEDGSFWGRGKIPAVFGWGADDGPLGGLLLEEERLRAFLQRWRLALGCCDRRKRVWER